MRTVALHKKIDDVKLDSTLPPACQACIGCSKVFDIVHTGILRWVFSSSCGWYGNPTPAGAPVWAKFVAPVVPYFQPLSENIIYGNASINVLITS